MDEITVGARYYNNNAGPQHVASFGRVDLAELLVFNRVLTPGELESLRKFVESSLETALALAELLSYLGIHSKSLFLWLR